MAKSKGNTEKKVKELFDKLGISEAFEISEDDESINIVIDAEDPGMIIGHHGDTLDSLQRILAMVISRDSGEFKRVSLEVGDYKKNRSDYLRNLAEQTKQKVLTEGREIYLPSLKPWERREVHMFLSEDEEVITESVGEGKERTLVVKPR
jgi:spoIIIJ-associated protein